MSSLSGSVHALPYCPLSADLHGMENPVHPSLKPVTSKRIKPLPSSLISVSIWIDPKMDWYGNPSGQRGRSQTFSNAAIEFCLTVAWLLGLSLRRAIEQTKSLLKTASLDWQVPDYSTLSRRKKQFGRLAVEGFCHGKTQAHLLVYDRGVSVVLNSDELGPNHYIAHERNWRMLKLTLKGNKGKV
ncbi:transposase|nr:transposase [Noviherbaspirillum sp. L7-7A]